MIRVIETILPTVLHDEFISAGITPITVVSEGSTATFTFQDTEDVNAIQAVIDTHDCEAIMLCKAKEAKIKEVSDLCTLELEKGFLSEAKGSSKLYSFNTESHIGILCIMMSISIDTEYQVYWKSSEALMPELWTAEEIKQLYKDAMEHKYDHCYKLFCICRDITAEADIEVVELYDWYLYPNITNPIWGSGEPPLPPRVDGGY